MSNNTGYYNKNGKLYYNGVEVIGGGDGEVHNTFNKIVIYGTSIEVTPSKTAPSSKCWPMVMANVLGLTYGTQVINNGFGGGGITWYGESTSNLAAYKNNILAGFSCTQQEKQAVADSFVSQGYLTAEEVAAAKNDGRWNLGYEKSVLEEDDVDLYIFGTYGINDRQNWMNWTDANGLQQTSYTVFGKPVGTAEPDADLSFDRRTIYGAYNHVLRALYNANPNAKVVILGQHTRQWTDQEAINDIQRAVAEKWQIPFADWGRYLSLNGVWEKATKQKTTYLGDIDLTLYQNDAVHLRTPGAELLGAWVADWITKTELKPFNPRWTL